MGSRRVPKRPDGDLIDAGDSVVAHIRQWGRRGRIVRATHHGERAEALAAAGVGQ
jgi:hypothetical protein